MISSVWAVFQKISLITVNSDVEELKLQRMFHSIISKMNLNIKAITFQADPFMHLRLRTFESEVLDFGGPHLQGPCFPVANILDKIFFDRTPQR